MAFKMKGHSLPGPHQRKSPARHESKKGKHTHSTEVGKKGPVDHATYEDGTVHDVTDKSPAKHTATTGKGPGGGDYIIHTHGTEDGKARISGGTTKDIDSIHTKSKQKARTETSPAKCPLLAAAPAIIGAVGAMKKKKEEDSPAKGWLSDTVKKGASKVKKHLKKKWDKTTQIGEGFKESLYADSDYTGAGTNIIDSFKKGYRKEKLADEKAAKEKGSY